MPGMTKHLRQGQIHTWQRADHLNARTQSICKERVERYALALIRQGSSIAIEILTLKTLRRVNVTSFETERHYLPAVSMHNSHGHIALEHVIHFFNPAKYFILFLYIFKCIQATL